MGDGDLRGCTLLYVRADGVPPFHPLLHQREVSQAGSGGAFFSKDPGDRVRIGEGVVGHWYLLVAQVVFSHGHGDIRTGKVIYHVPLALEEAARGL